MAVTAFVLIETAVGKTRDVSESLNGLQGLVSVDMVTGPYDIIAVIEAEDLKSIGRSVTQNIHTISAIQRTVTCLALGN
jgi:DNA-binding Lrp family transcriptional regulator